MRSIKFWLAAVVLGIVAYFALANNETVSVVVPWPWSFKTEAMAAIVYAGFFAGGVVFTTILLGFAYIRKSYALRKVKKELTSALSQSQIDTKALDGMES